MKDIWLQLTGICYSVEVIENHVGTQLLKKLIRYLFCGLWHHGILQVDEFLCLFMDYKASLLYFDEAGVGPSSEPDSCSLHCLNSFINIDFNITFPSTSRFPKQSLYCQEFRLKLNKKFLPMCDECPALLIHCDWTVVILFDKAVKLNSLQIWWDMCIITFKTTNLISSYISYVNYILIMSLFIFVKCVQSVEGFCESGNKISHGKPLGLMAGNLLTCWVTVNCSRWDPRVWRWLL